MTLSNKELPIQSVLTSLTQQDIRQWQEMKDPNWLSLLGSITKLFQLRKMPDIVRELPELNVKITKFSKSDIGPFLGEYYQDQILKKCMIILREDIREESGNVLLKKLAEVWTQFFTSILPTLQAIFATVEHQINVRTITLLSFRDIVVLKAPRIGEALDSPDTIILPEIRQMLLVLQSVHHTPVSDQYYQLQALVSKAIKPYLVMNRCKSPVGGKRKKASRGINSSSSFSEHDYHNRSISLSKPEDLDAVESDWLTRSGTIATDHAKP